jgi:hypothetical protein
VLTQGCAEVLLMRLQRELVQMMGRVGYDQHVRQPLS